LLRRTVARREHQDRTTCNAAGHLDRHEAVGACGHARQSVPFGPQLISAIEPAGQDQDRHGSHEHPVASRGETLCQHQICAGTSGKAPFGRRGIGIGPPASAGPDGWPGGGSYLTPIHWPTAPGGETVAAVLPHLVNYTWPRSLINYP